jgi:tRNA-Thr(GGU) m(6)t(6)A37 methyltransferase TsaA
VPDEFEAVMQQELLARSIGVVRPPLQSPADAPKQSTEGAPDAWLELHGDVAEGLDGLAVGDEIIVLTWFHRSRRDVLKLHFRDDPRNPITGVFATRSPDRPNPIGLHRVPVLEIADARLKVGPLEAIDGTPILDLEPVLSQSADH